MLCFAMETDLQTCLHDRWRDIWCYRIKSQLRDWLDAVVYRHEIDQFHERSQVVSGGVILLAPARAQLQSVLVSSCSGVIASFLIKFWCWTIFPKDLWNWSCYIVNPVQSYCTCYDWFDSITCEYCRRSTKNNNNNSSSNNNNKKHHHQQKVTA